MSAYILKIFGVALVVVIIDIILPSGKMEKIVKMAMSLIIVFVIASPIPGLITKVKNFNANEQNDLIDLEYVKKINLQKIDAVEEKIKDDLKGAGISNIEIELMCDLSSTQIKYIFANIDARSVVLEEKAQGIDLIETVKQSVLKFIQIEKENILVYE